MARLSDLPNEIIQMIVQLVSPDDIESLTSICKAVHFAAANLIKTHRDLKRKHAVYRYRDPRASGPRPSLAQLVVEILREPRTGFYVEELSIDGLAIEWVKHPDSTLRPEQQHLPYSEEVRSRLWDACLKRWPSNNCRFYWSRNIDSGREDPFLAILLRLLPNLTTLKLEHMPDRSDSNDFYHALLYQLATDEQFKGAYLSHLRHGQASHLTLLGLLAAQPSVTSVHGLGIRDNTTDVRLWLDDHVLPSPNLRDLTLTRCSINPKRLFNFLSAFPALRSFTYSSDHEPEETRGDFDFAWVRSGLFAFARSTLESLTLLSHNKDNHYMEEIHSFESVRSLHTESQLLLPRGRDHRQDELPMALPRNLETLKLECSGQGDEIGLEQLMYDLSLWRNMSVPALRKVELITRNGKQDLDASQNPFPNVFRDYWQWIGRNYTYESLAKYCEEHGFELTITAFERTEKKYYWL